MKKSINQFDAKGLSIHQPEELSLLRQIIRQEVNASQGYILLKNMNYNVDCPTKRELIFTKLAEALGKPEGHDAAGKIIWDVKPKPQVSSAISTFSEHNDEAPPHNDSVYSQHIEDTFGLLCVTPASDGGGRSIITSVASMISELEQNYSGQRMLQLLRYDNFPFAIPSIFIGKEGNPDQTYVVAPVLEKYDHCRFRLDLILKGFEKAPELWSLEKEMAARKFYELATSGRHSVEFAMEKGDILFGHNRRILHARTPFEDNSRHLLRIRMREQYSKKIKSPTLKTVGFLV
jgi:hypothetical protein